jgi:hypothetical protein
MHYLYVSAIIGAGSLLANLGQLQAALDDLTSAKNQGVEQACIAKAAIYAQSEREAMQTTCVERLQDKHVILVSR